MHKLIIDTDPGIDDAMAIQFALASPEFEILGLTTIFGNVDIEKTTTNALRLLHLAHRPDIPVAQGASRPLEGDFNGGVPFIHGEDGQGNTWASEGSLKPVAKNAHEFIIEQVRRFPGEITLATLGPLTNLAKALAIDSQIPELVKQVVCMGGNVFCPGNATPAAEANMFSDPEAADQVLGAKWPITLVGLDVTEKTILPKTDLDELMQNESAINQHVLRAYEFYQDFFTRVNKIDGSYVHDASVFIYLLNPSLYVTKEYPIRVDTTQGIGRGKTWPSLGESDQEGRPALLPWSHRPKIKVCTGVRDQAVIKLLKQRLME